MKVGLLVCDRVRREYRAEFGEYPEMFQALFPEYEFQFYEAYKGVFPESVTDCEMYMATGSSFSVYEDLEWIRKTKAFIKAIYEADRYFIGFCFGHQLMGEALGGKVAKSTAGWCVGIHEFEIYHVKHWMRPAKMSVNFLMMCQDQVMELPPNTIQLGGNEACPNAIIQVGQRMLGIQAHPEFSRKYDQTLMEARVERIGKETVTAGIASLEKSLDVALFRTWVSNFLQNN